MAYDVQPQPETKEFKNDILAVEKHAGDIVKGIKHKIAHNMFAWRHRDFMHAVAKVDKLLIKQTGLIKKVKGPIDKKTADEYSEIGAVQADMDGEFIIITNTVTSLVRGFMEYYENRKEFFEDYLTLGDETIAKAPDGEKLKNYVAKMKSEWTAVQSDIDKFLGHASGIAKESFPQGALPLITLDTQKLAEDEGFKGWERRRRHIKKGAKAAGSE